jgi:Tfp pilus assembly protein PilX
MAVTPARAEEYRRRAQECLDLARKISLERERAIILDMAQSWLRLAEQEAQEENPSPPAVEQPPQAAAQQQQQVQPKDEDKKE